MKKYFYLVWIMVYMISSIQVVGQKEDVKEKGVEYLKNSVTSSEVCVVAKTTQEVLDADIIVASLVINLGNKYNNAEINGKYFLRTNEELFPFNSAFDVLKSEQFLKSLNENYKLIKEEDGIKFRSLLFKLDDESREPFFSEGNTWYFIKSKFFNDISGYEVVTDTNGNITKIVYHSELKVAIPEKTIGSKSNIRYKRPDENYLSEEVKTKLVEKLKESANYTFELSKFDKLNVDLGINIFEGNVAIKELDELNNEYTSRRPFYLIGNGEQFSVAESQNKIMENQLFIDVVKNKFKIRNEKEAKEFETFIDKINEVKAEDKKLYVKDDIWFFEREKSFDDIYTYMVKVKDDGSIKYYDYSTIDSVSITKFKMKDPDFEVDYAFNLVKPLELKHKISTTESIPVEISFNEKMVNAVGGWILTKCNGKKEGIHAGTSIESPFTDDIPGKYLKKGMNIVEYVLLPPGQNYDNPLASIKIEVEVK